MMERGKCPCTATRINVNFLLFRNSEPKAICGFLKIHFQKKLIRRRKSSFVLQLRTHEYTTNMVRTNLLEQYGNTGAYGTTYSLLLYDVSILILDRSPSRSSHVFDT